MNPKLYFKIRKFYNKLVNSCSYIVYREIIAVNQDKLGAQARQVYQVCDPLMLRYNIIITNSQVMIVSYLNHYLVAPLLLYSLI